MRRDNPSATWTSLRLRAAHALRGLLFLITWGLGCTDAFADPSRAGFRQPAALRAEIPVVQSILAAPIGQSPLEAMYWPQALDTFSKSREAAALRQALLQRWLASLQPAGNFAPPTETIGQAIASVGSPDSTARARDATAWWNALLVRKLQIGLVNAVEPLPDEISNLRDRLVDVRPGVWVLRGNAKAITPVNGVPPAPGVYALVGLLNTSNGALALGPFEMDLLPERAETQNAEPAWSMACQSPRYQPKAPLAPHQTRHYLCRGPALQTDASAVGALLQTALQQQRWRIRSDALSRESDRRDIVDALAQPQQDTLRSFLAANASCEQRGTCGNEARQAKAHAAKAHSAAETRKRDGWAFFKGAATLLAATVVYIAIAHYISVAAASIALFVALAVPAYHIFQSARTMNTADSWGGFVVVPLMGLSILAPLALPPIAAWVYRTATNRRDRRRALHSIGYFVIVVLSMAVIDRILYLLF